MKLISFAVPCYNSAEYMEKCIDSLLKAGEDAEIIIVNDGSTKDNTKEIADRYAEKYPTIVKAVHQENGGHGEAVNQGLKNATGKYFKVIDSDDWVNEESLEKVMQTLRGFEEQTSPDCVIVNYVYEHVHNNTQKYIRYVKEFPQDRIFDFEESKKLAVGKFLAMHSLIYKKQVLIDCGLNLPKHTFYVDNLVICLPLPFVKTFYYINTDFYRYFIGRADQSINESVIMNRIDQHIRVTEIMMQEIDLGEIKKTRKKLYDYLFSHLQIMMTINSIYLIKINTPESFENKKALWQKLKDTDLETYTRCRRAFTGMASSNNKFVCAVCKVGYVIVRKIFKFN